MFEGGFTIFRIRGIPVKLHITLLVFLPYLAVVAASQFSSLAAAAGLPRAELRLPPLVWGSIMAIGLFIAILIHELAHSIIALRDGVHVRAITLMMLGGVSQMEDDIRPEREAWMAFAGPLTSFALAFVSYGIHRLLPLPAEISIAFLMFAAVNGVLGAFNLLPAFPMDGGRVLRGLLSGRLGADRATRVATTLGKIMAGAFAALGLISLNILLFLVAVFVYMGAAAEQSRYQARNVLRGMPVLQIMTDRIGEAHAAENAAEVARRLLQDNLVGARVVDRAGEPSGMNGGHTIGVVTAWDLSRAARNGTPAATVGDAMRTDLPVLHAYDDASGTLDILARSDANAVIVLDRDEHVIGIVTPAEVQRAMALLGAIGGRSLHR
jgi:Zn-dependent protease/predicted transcriptional regulator